MTRLCRQDRRQNNSHRAPLPRVARTRNVCREGSEGPPMIGCEIGKRRATHDWLRNQSATSSLRLTAFEVDGIVCTLLYKRSFDTVGPPSRSPRLFRTPRCPAFLESC